MSLIFPEYNDVLINHICLQLEPIDLRSLLSSCQYMYSNSFNIRIIYCLNRRGYAALEGWIDILKWFYENKEDMIGNFDIERGLYNNRSNVVKWLHNKGYSMKDNQCVLEYVGVTGNLTMFKYLYEECKYRLSILTINSAVLHGQLNIIKYLYEKIEDVRYFDYAVACATEKGHKDIIEYLLDNNCPFQASAVALAIINEYEDIGAILHEKLLNPALKFREMVDMMNHRLNR